MSSLLPQYRMGELHRGSLDLEAGDGRHASNGAFDRPWRWMVIFWRWMIPASSLSSIIPHAPFSLLRRRDLEAGDGRSEADEPSDDPFDITSTKHAPLDRLRRWRQAAFVWNASRRFRYTRDLNEEEQGKITARKFRAQAQATRAAQLFQAEGRQANGIPETPTPSGDYGISQEQLASMTRDHDVRTLGKYGGVEGLAELLKTNLEKGIHGDDADILARQNTYGSKTYPRKKGRSSWMLLWEAWQDLTLIILMIAAVALLVLGIMTKGIKEGWYDGGSIAFAVILVVVVTAISDYTQSLQFQNLFEVKRNTHLKVTRVNGRVEVSKYDLVVGDVVHLSTGDRVPADGVLIPGHSLVINESSMTGESETVHKDANDPFLMYGCKVVGGKGTMLVTSVGMSISEDTGEETPLQVQLNEIATFIGVVGLSVAVVVLVVLLARFFGGHTKTPDGSVQVKVGKTSVSDAVDGVIKIITIAVTIAVVAVPEGLPLAVTLILARSMRKMRADRALVRRLSACKTMVSVTTICTDKTAILTSNQDPCPGVQDEVRLCRNAGVKVQMVTGDNMQNAKAIALECGILDSEAEATLPNLIEGKAFRSLTDAEREEAAEKISVMGRSSPNDKLLLVQALKRRGQIVAVTGDDNNDVPALCEADVGLAMGIQATEVAKESSDIMILDDNFASVFKVLKWGRSVYANIQKSVQFQLTINVSALTINSIAAVFLGCVPLNAVQLLWVNLITSTLGAFALATEPPTDDLMHMDPVDRRECLVTDPIWGHIRKQAAYQASVLLFLLFQGRSLLNLEHDTSDHANKVINTLIFNTFILCQIVNEFNAWNPDKFNVFGGITKNHLFTGMVVLTLILQVIIIEFLGKFTSTVRLDRKQWIIAIIIAFIGWPVDAIPI